MKYLKLFESYFKNIINKLSEEERDDFINRHKCLDVTEYDLEKIKNIIRTELYTKLICNKYDADRISNYTKIIKYPGLDEVLIKTGGYSGLGEFQIYKYDDEWWLLQKWISGGERNEFDPQWQYQYRYWLIDSMSGLEEFFKKEIK